MRFIPAVSRRRFLGGFSAAALASALPHWHSGHAASAAGGPAVLRLQTRTLDVHGKASTVYGIIDSTGRPGLNLVRSSGFDVRLINHIGEATILHWHGLTPPASMDGSNLSQQPLQPGESMDFRFELARTGSNWMHSHMGLQEQMMMAAPLIVRDEAEALLDRQEVVVLLHDFSFTPPEEILAKLVSDEAGTVGSGIAAHNMGMVRSPAAEMDHSAMPGMGAPAGMASMDHGTMSGGMAMDINDIEFDAYLANDRDLSDPEVVRVERGGHIRLRVINAASSTNFWIDLGNLSGMLVAVDGRDIDPIVGRRFEIAMAQRLDIDLTMPNTAATLPIVAQREGGRQRTGIILATHGSSVSRLGSEAETIAPPVLLDLERKLTAADPLDERSVDRVLSSDLTGSMHGYRWGFDGRGFEERLPLEIAAGERVEITLNNRTMMSHPMHLHGHHFQVVALGGYRIGGAVRDTVIVPAMESLTIAFDADNPGEWPLHCHNLYHMAAGMMTSVKYV